MFTTTSISNIAEKNRELWREKIACLRIENRSRSCII